MRGAKGIQRRASLRTGLGKPRGGDHRRRFLRHAHIFASTVREVLETRLLRQATPLPLTLCQFHVLRLMALNGRHQVGEVADFLGVSAPAATRNIDKLERLGLMERNPSKGDRRAKLLTVSTRGRALVGEYDQIVERRLDAVLAGCREDEANQLSGALERFSLSLLKSEGIDGSQRLCLRCTGYLDEACPVGRLRGGCPYQEHRGSGESVGKRRCKGERAETGLPAPSRRMQTTLRRGR